MGEARANYQDVDFIEGAEDNYGVAIGGLKSDDIPVLVFANSNAPNFAMLGRCNRK